MHYSSCQTQSNSNLLLYICSDIQQKGMKRACLILATICLSAASCTTHFGNRKLADGWYHVENTENNIVKNRPIVKAEDFTGLRLDSCRIEGSDLQIYTITGTCNDAGKFADATEKAIGKHIAFIFDGKMVCAPKVNARIDSGNFMISLPTGTSHFDAVMVLEALKKQAKNK